MLPVADYTRLDACAIAQEVRRGALDPAEVAAAAEAALEAVNPALNAVIGRTPGEARRALAGLDRAAPLAGVPFLIKDIGMMMAGVPSTMGSRFTQGLTAPADTGLAERFKAAGVITLGRTNTPECGCALTTEPLLYGPSRNPWSLEHSPGGSSGGAAAAVAAGVTPIAHANDGGGSIRFPAAACGLVGLKPTRGRQPSGPGPEYLNGMSNELAVSRTVRDTALVMDATCAPDWGARSIPPQPAEPYLTAIERPPPPLRIAFSWRPPDAPEAEPDCKQAVEHAARLLSGLGHHVEEADAGVSALEGYRLWVRAACLFGAQLIGQLEAALGCAAGPDNMEAVVWKIISAGRTMTAAHVADAAERMNLVSRAMAAFLNRYDVWVTPAMLRPAMRLGDFNANDPDISLEGYAERMTAYGGWLALNNVSGQPGLTLPLWQTAGGLPVGVHFTARFGDEATLLRLGAQLEQAAPWSGRRPAVHAASCQTSAS